MRSFDSDIAIVGAGPAGIGTAVALEQLDVTYTVIERDRIGASFRQWPAEMRLLTPSFPANAFGERDLNAVTPDTSPGLALDCEHPTGEQYAEYLEAVAEFHDLDIECGVDVEAVIPTKGGFTLQTDGSDRHVRYVVWAAGEFQYPSDGSIPGASHAVHVASIDSWGRHATLVSSEATGVPTASDSSPQPIAAGESHLTEDGDTPRAGADGAGATLPAADDVVVIGGAESGIDTAIELAENDLSVTVIDEEGTWQFRSPDPSEVLSPRTNERLETALSAGAPIDLVAGERAARIERHHTDEGYDVVTTDGDRIRSRTPPILATGFESSLTLVDDLFTFEDGVVSLTDRDESTETPGLFLAGPQVAHNGQQFCFIYKYRKRFGVVAETIGDRLGVETSPIDWYRETAMLLEDFDCCEPEYCDC